MDLIDYGARWYDPQIGRFISPDTIIPDYTNPQSLNRYSYTYGNPLKYIDPSGHEPCGTTSWGDCFPIISSPGGAGKDPAKEGNWSCEDTLANCFRQGVAEGTKKLKQFDDHENVELGEIEDLTDAIYEDLQTRDTSLLSDVVHGSNLMATGRFSGGRFDYDTPLWNGYQYDATICINQHGCWSRSHVNYVAQGMWAAAGGNDLEDTLWAPQTWNEQMYGHPPEEGELYWTEYGWRRWHEIDGERNPPPPNPHEVEMEILE